MDQPRGLFSLLGKFREFLAKLDELGLNPLEMLEALSLVGKVFQLPDWKDKDDVQAWFLNVTNAGDFIAEKTPAEWDDDLVDAIRKAVEDDAKFDAIYELIFDVVDGDTEVLPLPDNARVMATADKAGISPAVIILIVQLAVEAFKLWRDRKGADS
jgi:soluble lytic murein transglycosylase-like protein